jgi:RNA polymerase sigma-70 factor (ECF subfamily)
LSLADVPARADEDAWLADFQAGARPIIEACYRDHFDAVYRSVGSVIRGADRDAIVHEVFVRLLTRPEVRAGFRGGSIRAWLSALGRNLALDEVRRRKREQEIIGAIADQESSNERRGPELDVEERLMVEAFCREHVEPEWMPVFEARFLRQLTQREAAGELGIQRTTLAYRELRIRRRLKRFLLREGSLARRT